MKLTVGSDIEFFISTNRDTHPKSIVPGKAVCNFSKDEPYCHQHGRMHWDNLLLEICPDEATTEDEFLVHIKEMMAYAATKAKEKQCQLTPYASAYVSHDLATSETGTVFGCDPDMNAYTRTFQTIDSNMVSNLRTAGGHIHIGLPEAKTMAQKVILAKLCDLYLGIPSVLLDQDRIRRRLYGKAGSFRPKPYGIEYRTLSNYWAFNDRYIKWVYNQVEEIADFFKQVDAEVNSSNDEWKAMLNPEVSAEIAEIINQHDVRKARAHIKLSNIAMP